jgi:hypothetical protein
MLDLRLIKWLVWCVLSLYLFERQLPLIMESLSRSITALPRELRFRKPRLWRRYLMHRAAVLEHLETERQRTARLIERLIVMAAIGLCL